MKLRIKFKRNVCVNNGDFVCGWVVQQKVLFFWISVDDRICPAKKDAEQKMRNILNGASAYDL